MCVDFGERQFVLRLLAKIIIRFFLFFFTYWCIYSFIHFYSFFFICICCDTLWSYLFHIHAPPRCVVFWSVIGMYISLSLSFSLSLSLSLSFSLSLSQSFERSFYRSLARLLSLSLKQCCIIPVVVFSSRTAIHNLPRDMTWFDVCWVLSKVQSNMGHADARTYPCSCFRW